jgi:hypothetical protein
VPAHQLAMREVDGLVGTEELNFNPVEKHIFAWEIDLDDSPGVNKLEMTLAQRLMQEGALLVNSLRAYAVSVESAVDKSSLMIQR